MDEPKEHIYIERQNKEGKNLKAEKEQSIARYERKSSIREVNKQKWNMGRKLWQLYVSIIPVNMAERNGIKRRALDPDEPNYSSMRGTELTILGQSR